MDLSSRAQAERRLEQAAAEREASRQARLEAIAANRRALEHLQRASAHYEAALRQLGYRWLVRTEGFTVVGGPGR